MACIGLAIFHRFVHVEVRRAHNDLAGFTIAIISVVYAVLLAFIAVATWESFAAAQTMAQTEASYIGNLYRDTEGFPPNVGERMRQDLKRYVDMVIRAEWPVQRQGEVPEAGWASLRDLHLELVQFQPQTPGQTVMQAEFLRSLNDLYRARTARLTAVRGHVPSVIWWIISAGGALTTVFTYLFGFHSFRMHLTMTSSVAAALALVAVLIIALDWPFRGDVSITTDAYLEVERGWTDAAAAKE
jgi:hypothetical protein